MSEQFDLVFPRKGTQAGHCICCGKPVRWGVGTTSAACLTCYERNGYYYNPTDKKEVPRHTTSSTISKSRFEFAGNPQPDTPHVGVQIPHIRMATANDISPEPLQAIHDPITIEVIDVRRYDTNHLYDFAVVLLAEIADRYKESDIYDEWETLREELIKMMGITSPVEPPPAPPPAQETPMEEWIKRLVDIEDNFRIITSDLRYRIGVINSYLDAQSLTPAEIAAVRKMINSLRGE